jgi:hypothetical protein
MQRRARLGVIRDRGQHEAESANHPLGGFAGSLVLRQGSSSRDPFVGDSLKSMPSSRSKTARRSGIETPRSSNPFTRPWAIFLHSRVAHARSGGGRRPAARALSRRSAATVLLGPRRRGRCCCHRSPSRVRGNRAPQTGRAAPGRGSHQHRALRGSPGGEDLGVARRASGLTFADIARTPAPIGSFHLVTIYREVRDGIYGWQRER